MYLPVSSVKQPTLAEVNSPAYSVWLNVLIYVHNSLTSVRRFGTDNVVFRSESQMRSFAGFYPIRITPRWQYFGWLPSLSIVYNLLLTLFAGRKYCEVTGMDSRRRLVPVAFVHNRSPLALNLPILRHTQSLT